MFFRVRSADFDYSHPIHAMLSEGREYGMFIVSMTYGLGGGHETPVHKGIRIIRGCPRIHGAISRHRADIAIVSFIESAGFDDRDGNVGILGQARRDC